MPTETIRPFAVVTGASTGIGHHLARVFADNGFDVDARVTPRSLSML